MAPLRTIVGARTGFGTFTNYTALDLVNNEIVSQSNNGVGVAVFPRTANGNVAPTRNIAGAATGLVDVTGIVVDNGNNRLLISDDSPNQLRAFARTANGNVAPLLVVAGAATGLSRPTVPALDAAGGFSGVGGVVVLPANPPLPIPLLDPASLALIALGLLALGLARLARRRER